MLSGIPGVGVTAHASGWLRLLHGDLDRKFHIDPKRAFA